MSGRGSSSETACRGDASNAIGSHSKRAPLATQARLHTSAIAEFDVFLSYARADRERVLRLRDELCARGLAVWFDETDIEPFAGISSRVADGLASSRVFVAAFSAEYPTRRPCQWELTAAFTAAQRLGDPRERVLVANLEAGTEHIVPVELRDALYASLADADGIDRAADAITRRALAADGVLGGLSSAKPRHWFGREPIGAARFVGRIPDMWSLHSALWQSENVMATGGRGAALAQVTGLGGIGKSALVEEYALRFEAAYPGGILWIRGYGDVAPSEDARPALRTEQLRAFGLALGMPDGELVPDRVVGALAHALEQVDGSYLWIVDDLPADLSHDEFEAYLAPSRSGKTVVTTRGREHAARGSTIRLDRLSSDDGVALLSSHLGAQSPETVIELRALVADLGGHPLALEITGSALRLAGGTRSISEYRASLESLSHDELELAADLASALPPDHRRSIAATISRSLSRASAQALDLLRLGAIAAAHPISADLIADVFAELGDPAQAQALAARSVGDAELVSLVEIRDDTAREVHPLVSRTMRFRDADERRFELRAAAVAALSKRLAAAGPGARGLDDAVHARHVVMTTYGVSPAASDFGSEMGLVLALAHHDGDRGDHASSLALLTAASELGRAVVGETHKWSIEVERRRAMSLSHLGRYPEAREILERDAAELEHRLGADSEDVLVTRSNLAHVLRSAGDLAGALRVQEDVYERAKLQIPEEDPRRLAIANLLAETRGEAGDIGGAIAMLQVVAEASRRVRGHDDIGTIAAETNLGMMYVAAGRTNEALLLLEACRATCTSTLGDDHPITLNITDNVAAAYGSLGMFERAIELYESGLAGQRRARGSLHPDTLVSAGSLGATLQKARGGDAGIELLEEAVAAGAAVFDPGHPAFLMAKHNLAEARRATNPWASLVLHKEVLDARAEMLGWDHHDTLMSRNNTALAVTGLADKERGARMLAEVKASADARLAVNHPFRIQISTNLRDIHTRSDLTPLPERSAIAARRAVQALFDAGADSPEVLGAVVAAGQVATLETGGGPLPRMFLQAGYDLAVRLQGLTEAQTRQVERMLAMALALDGEVPAARERMQRHLETCAEEAEDERLGIFSVLAVVAQADDDPELAIAYLEQAVASPGGAPAPGNEAAMIIALELADALRDAGRPAEAVRVYTSVIEAASDLSFRHPIKRRAGAGYYRARKAQRRSRGGRQPKQA